MSQGFSSSSKHLRLGKKVQRQAKRTQCNPMHSHKNWQSRTVARSTPHLLNTPEPARIIKSGASPHILWVLWAYMGIFQLGLLFSSQLDMKGSHLSPRQRRESEHVEPCAQKSQPRLQHGAWCQWPSGLPHLRRLLAKGPGNAAKSSSAIKLSLIIAVKDGNTHRIHVWCIC